MRKLKQSAIKHVGEYVDNRLKGHNKRDSALLAGYSLETAETPSLIENTKAYALVVTKVLEINGAMMLQLVDQMQPLIDRNDPDSLFTLDTRSKIYLRFAQAEKILTPQVTVKETTDSKGNKTRTVWGTGSAPLNETV